MSKERLFSDFQGVSKEDWKQKIELDLKGKLYSNLCAINGAGLQIEPVYTSEDVNLLDESPNSGSYRRGTKTNNNDWEIDETFQITQNAKEDNKNLHKKLNSGLTSVTLSGEFTAGLLNEVLPEYISLGFSNYTSITSLINELKKVLGENENSYELYFNYDPIGKASLNGFWNRNEELELAIDSIKSLHSYKAVKVFTVNGKNYHNAGGNAISELAFSLAHAHEYFIKMREAGFSIKEASSQIKVDLASGGDYFLEIAKIRSFRMLWAKLMESYTPNENNCNSIVIHSHTSQFLSTLYDPYVNMLRATTQSMSAVLGGCDILSVLPYNTAWENGSDFSNRIARNVQLILKEESYFDKVIDPSGGSYYIEQLTDDLGEKAWDKFKKIEKKGGFIGLMESGNLDRELKEDAQVQLDKLEKSETKVLGVNIFPNPEDKMLDKLNELNNNSDLAENDKMFKAINLLRLVGKTEESRLEKELEEAK